ncbi:formate dehydrogenase subunit alpha [Methylophaga sp.]|uniref:formate dehydrogenase subunit alpha n=1 Tax=Methylophaga sp. TaxID=2024840 RepID=UPI003F6A363D
MATSEKSTQKVLLTVDKKTVNATEGELLIEVLYRQGIKIPSLCYSPGLSCTGSCRACLVQLNDSAVSLPACEITVAQNMQVTVQSATLERDHRAILSMLLENYVDSDFDANAIDHTEFDYWLRRYDLVPHTAQSQKPLFKVDSDPHPAIRVDLNKCILCTRCIRACNEVQGRFVWGLAERSDKTQITAGLDQTMLEAGCESCGACVAYCPTGALSDRDKSSDGVIDEKVMTTCAYCGVGCNLDLNISNGRLQYVTSNPHAPVNGMHLCVKGRYGNDYVHHPDRLTQPLVREWLLNDTVRSAGDNRGKWVPVEWDQALDIVAKKFSKIIDESGPDALAIFSSAKCTNEENYLMQKFARQVIGTHNVDHCARLCHSSTVAGLAASFGSGAMSNTMADIAGQAEALFVIGSNTTEQHPVFGSMLRQAVHQRDAKLIVADPRKIDLTEFATLHLRHRPGTDIALINGLMQLIIENGWQDDDFINNRTEDFETLRESLTKYTTEYVSAITGVSPDDLIEAATILGKAKPMAVIWAMGITQHIVGVQNVFSLANLQMLTGNMGLPGGGVNPLRGQNNVQGACDLGCLPNVFPGYQAVSSDTSLTKFSDAWALTNRSQLFSESPGLTITEMIDGGLTGDIRGFYILAENTVMTDPDVNHVREAMANSEFTVLQEIFPSETAEYADVLLPGVTFAEKAGTFTNTERRIQLIHDAVESPGEAREDWQITAQLAKRILDYRQQAPAGELAGWDYASVSEVMDEIAQLTPSYAGVSHERLHKGEQLHWPVIDKQHPGTPILHVDKFTRGKGIFHPAEHLPAKELPDEEYPLCLTTGRVLYHWHGAEMTRRSEPLKALYPSTLVEISIEDAGRLGIHQQQTIRIVSRRGEMIAEAEISERVPPGLIFGNFHFPDEANVNNLTIAALDPIAKIPEYKVCAVRVEAMD